MAQWETGPSEPPQVLDGKHSGSVEAACLCSCSREAPNKSPQMNMRAKYTEGEVYQVKVIFPVLQILIATITWEKDSFSVTLL